MMRGKLFIVVLLALFIMASVAFAAWTPPEKVGGYYPDTAVDKDDTEILGWATGYQDYYRSDGGTGYSDPGQALGQAEGTSTDIVSLGEINPPDDSAQPGELTLTFDEPIGNGDGWDIAVFENPFGNSFPDNLFGELGYVEVSTDGVTFVRFPNISEIPDVSGSFAFFATGLCYNLAGRQVQGTGDGFDLDDLADEPEVLSGDVNLNNINYVKIVDVPGYGDAEAGFGGFLDSFGNPIHDNWPTSGSGGFDLDAVAYHYAGQDVSLIGVNAEVWTLNLLAGDQTQIIAYGAYDNGTEEVIDVDWSSDDSGVVAIDNDGNVTAVGVGTCTITATHVASGLTDSFEAMVGYDLFVINGLDNVPTVSLYNNTTDNFVDNAGFGDWTSPNGIEVRGTNAYVVLSGGFSANPMKGVMVFDTKALIQKRFIDLSSVAGNPYDIAFASDNLAFVSSFNDDLVVAINPKNGQILYTITLPNMGFDLSPEGVEVVGNRLFIACTGMDQSNYSYAGFGMVFVYDFQAGAFVDADDSIAGTDPIYNWSYYNTQWVKLASSGYLFVLHTGNYWSDWSAVDVVNPNAAGTTADPFLVTTIALGDNVTAGGIAPAPNGKVYVQASGAAFLYSVDDTTFAPLRTATVSEPIVVPNGGSGYFMPSGLVFKDGACHGLEFATDWYWAFMLSSDTNTGQPTFFKDTQLVYTTDAPAGSQFLAFGEPIDGEWSAIELISFQAEANETDVELTWETATEADNAGFRMWRSGSETGTYTQITSSMIPGSGSEMEGASYAFMDTGLEAGATYYYKLEDVNINGVSTFHGPTSVTLDEEEPEIGCGVVNGGQDAGLLVLLFVAGAMIAITRRKTVKKGYKRPEVKTTSSDEVVKKVGPAQTCSPSPSECPTAQ